MTLITSFVCSHYLSVFEFVGDRMHLRGMLHQAASHQNNVDECGVRRSQVSADPVPWF